MIDVAFTALVDAIRATGEHVGGGVNPDGMYDFAVLRSEGSYRISHSARPTTPTAWAAGGSRRVSGWSSRRRRSRAVTGASRRGTVGVSRWRRPSATMNSDRSVRVVLAHEDPGEPNWLDTCGFTEGSLIFRFLYPEAKPDRPATEVLR